MPEPLASTKVTLEGNFFTRDPRKTVRGNIRDMMRELAEWMETEARAQVRAAPLPRSVGWTAGHIKGRTESPKTGRHWDVTAVASANTWGMSERDATRTLAAASGVERRFHPFRRVKSGLFRARPLIVANLTKGLD